MFIEYLWKEPAFYITWVVLIIFSVCVHEYLHAWVAYSQGDTSVREGGHLDLNPLQAMGGVSLVVLLFFGIAWGAVPVNAGRLRRTYSEALVAFAGPFANFLLAAAFAALNLVAGQIADGTIQFICHIGVAANLFLMFFNLLPIPILDGWDVYAFFIPPMRNVSRQKAQQFGFIALLVILLLGWHGYIWQAAFQIATRLTGTPM